MSTTTEKINEDVTGSAANVERVQAIQQALREAGLDGWLFYDFRRSDPLAYRILRLDSQSFASRRWFYYLPSEGEPVKIVHRIEDHKLDLLPGKRLVYLSWQQLHDHLGEALKAGEDGRESVKRIAMQYYPENGIPYVSRVDAGTVELVRSYGVEVVTSADLVQVFEAVWSPEQKAAHDVAAGKVRRIIHDAFSEIARRTRADEATTEYDIQQFIMRRFEEEGMTSDGAPPIVAVNANSAKPHYGPTVTIHSPIYRGDFVLLDVWAKLKKRGAVYADLSWTGYVGSSVPEEYVKIFEIVRKARDSAVSFIRESLKGGQTIKGAQVDDVSRAVIQQADYGDNFLNRTGHSIGEEVHGNGANIDNLETPDDRLIMAHTCFSIEPGIYLEGNFGLRSEINVYVGDGDAEVTGLPIQTEVVPILRDEGKVFHRFR